MKEGSLQPQYRIVVILFVILALTSVIWGGQVKIQTPDVVAAQVTTTPLPALNLSPTPTTQGESEILVSRVIDGDTIELGNGQRLRYIGIDSPETVDPRLGVQCFGKQAFEENKRLVEGRLVLIETDVSDTDRFKRLLRYVRVEGVFVNDYLVRNGYAKASTYPPDVKYQKQFQEAEGEARLNKRGMWADGVCL